MKKTLIKQNGKKSNLMENHKKSIIIGAGPAGLTAAYELLQKSNIKSEIIEQTESVGGISRTVDFKGNKIDIGGHRFFTKSKQINHWWENILPYEDKEQINPDETDEVMLIRDRLSRIYFLKKLFQYPIQLNTKTFSNLGLYRTIKIGFSYIKIRLTKEEKIQTLEDLFIHRFGKELYQTFFKSYTEKVWGIPCQQIRPEWGSQRIKNLSVAKTIIHALKENFISIGNKNHNSQVTSLIKKFHYPKYGPGQLWELVAKQILNAGGNIQYNQKVVAITPLQDNTFNVAVKNLITKEIKLLKTDYIISSMPVKDLIKGFNADVPDNVKKTAQGLIYRDFIIIGLLLKKLNKQMADQWIYIQEPDIKMGRLQLFNNWSPYLIQDKNQFFVGAEYFCSEGDALWNLSQDQLIAMAIDELIKMAFIEQNDCIEGIVIKQAKAYPAYFGTYDQFPIIQSYLDQFENLFLIGRNGMHRYNNMDHSMMSAILAVDHIINETKNKNKLWEINTQDELHENN